MKRSLLAVLVPALLVAGACSAVFRQPVVTLETFRLESIGLRGGTMVARVHVENPNGYDLRMERLDYTIEIADPDADGAMNWQQLAVGEFVEEVRVPGNTSARVDIPITFNFSDLGGLLRPILDRGVITYRVRGRVDVEEPVSRTVPYRHEGRVTLSGVQ